MKSKFKTARIPLMAPNDWHEKSPKLEKEIRDFLDECGNSHWLNYNYRGPDEKLLVSIIMSYTVFKQISKPFTAGLDDYELPYCGIIFENLINTFAMTLPKDKKMELVRWLQSIYGLGASNMLHAIQGRLIKSEPGE